MSFHVGQKVACIHDYSKHPSRFPGCAFPTLNHVYTIRRIDMTEMGEGLWLIEIRNPRINHRQQEPGFSSHHFRPVVDRPTDISVLTALLTPAKLTEDA